MSTSLGELSASPAVSVILPVLNEEPHLEESVSAILSQDYLGIFEVILALGPSRDRTDEIAQALAAGDNRVKLVANPTGKTAAGLNLAVATSNNPIIVRVDGHAKIPNNYLSLAVEILRRSGAVNVGGVMAAEGVTNFEIAVARAMRSALGVGSSRFHTGGEAGEVDTVYLGAFRREAITAVGGFDERYTRAQDWELNYRLRKNGGKIYFDPRLQVTYRPRPNLRKLAKQYFQYGRWRRVVSRSHSGTINLRYLAPPFTLIATLISLFLGLFINPIFYLPAAIYGFFLLISSVLIAKSMREFISLLAIIPTMHFAWGAGFITSTKALR
ncbi:glycosyltransferase family 2 protein [Actinobacteria bacterium IMCC26103]|nr:glycosyltransferase family 2 protein [Actinobacteria bacterium IMCC26103]